MIGAALFRYLCVGPTRLVLLYVIDLRMLLWRQTYGALMACRTSVTRPQAHDHSHHIMALMPVSLRDHQVSCIIVRHNDAGRTVGIVSHNTKFDNTTRHQTKYCIKNVRNCDVMRVRSLTAGVGSCHVKLRPAVYSMTLIHRISSQLAMG